MFEEWAKVKACSYFIWVSLAMMIPKEVIRSHGNAVKCVNLCSVIEMKQFFFVKIYQLKENNIQT